MHAEFDLIKKCLKGNLRAQSELYRKYSSVMFAVCLRFACNRMEAEDMLQNGFIKVFSNLEQYKMKGSFEGWMRRIMVTTAINHIRKNHKIIHDTEIELLESKVLASENIYDQLSASEIMALIMEMPYGYKMVFSLYVIEGYSHQEIAEMLEINEGTSKSQLSRAKSYLRERIVLMKREKTPVYG